MQAWAREEKLEAYDQSSHGGYLRHLVFREGRNTGQVLVDYAAGGACQPNGKWSEPRDEGC